MTLAAFYQGKGASLKAGQRRISKCHKNPAVALGWDMSLLFGRTLKACLSQKGQDAKGYIAVQKDL